MYTVINDYKWRIPSPINLVFVIPRLVYYSSKEFILKKRKKRLKIRRLSHAILKFCPCILLVFSVLGACKSIKVSEEVKDNKIKEYLDDFQKTAALRINCLGVKWLEWGNILRQLFIFVYTNTVETFYSDFIMFLRSHWYIILVKINVYNINKLNKIIWHCVWEMNRSCLRYMLFYIKKIKKQLKDETELT